MAQYTCKQGKLVIDDRNIQIIAPFRQVVWTVPRTIVSGVSLQRGVLLNSVIFHAAGSTYRADSIGKKNSQEIVQQFTA